MKSARAQTATSARPLVRKLGIKPGLTLALDRPPDGFDETLGELPDGVALRRRLRGPCDVIVSFHVRGAELERRLPVLTAALAEDGGLWLAWPKANSGLSTDLSDRIVRELGLATGLVDNKVCAIDGTWSGLRFVYRLANRSRT